MKSSGGSDVVVRLSALHCGVCAVFYVINDRLSLQYRSQFIKKFYMFQSSIFHYNYVLRRIVEVLALEVTKYYKLRKTSFPTHFNEL